MKRVIHEHMIGAIFPTESALKMTFDKDGNRKLIESSASDN